MIYKIKEGKPFRSEDAQLIGMSLEKIRIANPLKILIADRVVVASTKSNAPLHRFFEWDDTNAASKYRIDQARLLIRSIVIEHKAMDDDVRQYVSVHIKNEGQAYIPTDVALADVRYRDQVLQKAFMELKAFKRKYGALNELSKLIKVIDEIV